MRTVGNLTLRISRESEHSPQRVSVAVAGAAIDAEGFVHITPDCITLDARAAGDPFQHPFGAVPARLR